MFLPVSFVHRDKTYNPVVDQEKPAENNFLGALPNPPRGTKTKSERDTKPQCVTNEDEEHEYESIDLIVYVALCFKYSNLAENCCEEMCLLYVYVYVIIDQ